MPYKDPEAQRQAVSDAVKRRRIYEAAVERGDPLALKAEEQLKFSRKPGEEALLLWDWIAALPTKEERMQHKGKYLALRQKCEAKDYPEKTKAEYERLRAEVIASAELDKLI